MNRFLHLGLFLAVVLTVVSGAIHGRTSQRWGPPPETTQVAERLTEFPAQFGDWELQESLQLTTQEVEVLQCHGYLYGQYVNQATKETVTAALLIGPPGPISLHVPEICYSSQDYTIINPRQKFHLTDVTGEESEFWGLTIQSNNVEQSLQRVYYGWRSEHPWEAADLARIRYMACPYLAKIQVTALLPAAVDADADADACQQFLKQFIPALKRHVFR